jgi:hypothetical protein
MQQLARFMKVLRISSTLSVKSAVSRQRVTRVRVPLLRSGIMNDFYNVEYMSERVAALAKERDELRREVRRLNEICERQARLNLVNAKLAMDLDKVTAERDALRARLNGKR